MSWRLRHPSTVVSRWLLQSAAGVITPDAYGRYPGTLVNAPTWGVGPKNSLQCIELDGNNQYVRVGDITQLNAVSAFTICFWMAQDVIDTTDTIFQKFLNGSAYIWIFTNAGDGSLYVQLYNGPASFARFDYSLVISAGNWHHVAVVYDGSQVGNVNRLIIYVDGVPITLIFAGNIPATTANMSPSVANISRDPNAFDGRLWDMRLANVPYTRDEVNKIIHQPAPVF